MTSCLLPWRTNLSKEGLFLEDRISSYRGKFFHFRVNPVEKRGKLKMAELLPLKVYIYTVTHMLL